MMHEHAKSWLHRDDCDCTECEPYRPSVPQRLTGRDIGWLVGIGMAIGHAIAFTVDPAGAAWALRSALGLGS